MTGAAPRRFSGCSMSCRASVLGMELDLVHQRDMSDRIILPHYDFPKPFGLYLYVAKQKYEVSPDTVVS